MAFCVYARCDQTAMLLSPNDDWVFKGSEARLFDTRVEAELHAKRFGDDAWVREIPADDLHAFLEEDWTW